MPICNSFCASLFTSFLSTIERIIVNSASSNLLFHQRFTCRHPVIPIILMKSIRIYHSMFAMNQASNWQSHCFALTWIGGICNLNLHTLADQTLSRALLLLRSGCGNINSNAQPNKKVIKAKRKFRGAKYTIGRWKSALPGLWDRASPKRGSLLGSRGFAEQFCAHLARGRRSGSQSSLARAECDTRTNCAS